MNNQQHKGKMSNYDLHDYFKLPNPNVRGYFNRVVEGQPDIYTTPWVKGKTNAEKLINFKRIVDEWMPHLSVLKDKWPTLYEYEIDQMAKVGPMSIMKSFAERIDDIEAYYEGILLPSDPIPQDAINLTLKEFKSVKGLRPRSLQNTWDVMKKSTSAGAPFYKKKKLLSKEELYPRDWTAVRDHGVVAAKYDSGDFYIGAMLGWRGQEGGPTEDDTKQRVVWMFPASLSVEELSVYQPLIEACQKHELVPAWVSMELVDERVTRLFDTKSSDQLIVCTDFTKFDQHFNVNCQNCAEQIIRSLFSDSIRMQYWLDVIYPTKYTIPLLCTDRLLRRGRHGMGSGSGGTNADETLLHRTLQHEAAMKQNQVLNPNSMCLGDDGILTFPGINVNDVTETYSSHGLDMNLTKQYASAQDCTYLRRWHHVDYRVDGICVGVYPTMRALGRLCMQERYYDPDSWDAKMVCLRELSILENCKWSPLFEEFVEFCMKKDKFRLGLDIPGFLDDIAEIAKKATDLMPDFLGYTKSLGKNAEAGIQNWAIVKYLKSKR